MLNDREWKLPDLIDLNQQELIVLENRAHDPCGGEVENGIVYGRGAHGATAMPFGQRCPRPAVGVAFWCSDSGSD
ncbi:MAG: hypothetical protein V1245_01515 [Arenicellales bacterium]|nr:hypothetical protein [Arenicellales bacterium]MDP6313181.1 hypothetical protein [Arenicellales bacterium]MDP7119670.1 hypothetical protein [Arenicellales bacterium]MDP7192540.1 hypothetical protein [Arenicellales bacterium]MDP7490812.1 hypothetical protein [Arenicellales bacterium]